MSEAAGQINVYTCRTCGGHIVTRNRDAGTTPFSLRCRAKAGCDGDMYSGLYRVNQSLAPGWEWYAPTSAAERKKVGEGYREHVAMGGLMLRSLAH